MKDYDRLLSHEEVAEMVGEGTRLVEIGCNDGRDTARFLDDMPKTFIDAFEPDRRAIAAFRKRIPESETRVTLHEVAVADVDGQRPWWRSGGFTELAGPEGYNLSGSLLEPTGHLDQDPRITFTGGHVVPTIRLDTWFANAGEPKIDFLWMDVQGGEQLVISGGLRAVSACRYIYTEYSDTELYLHQPNLHAICALLTDHDLVATYQSHNALFRRET